MLYLNPAGLSPFHPDIQKEVSRTLAAFSRVLYSEAGVKLYRETFQQARETIARWLELTDPQRLAFVSNTTTACSLILSRINWKTGDTVLTTTHENATILYEIDSLRTRGVQVLSLDPDAAPGFLPAFEHLLNKHSVRAIVISHVSHLDGRIFPLPAIQALARTHRVLFMVDGAQAVGHIPVSFRQLQPDAYFFPGHKWCAGPMGTGALILGKEFVRTFANPDETQDLRKPDQPGWMGFELGTHNIGLIAGLAKACSLKHQEGLQSPVLDSIREEWKTCLKRYEGVRILEWDGPQAPGILSFHRLDETTAQVMQTTAVPQELPCNTFSNPSEPSKLSIRLSWAPATPLSDIRQALACFSSPENG
mgnify:CR=1 FL=1